MGRNYIAQKINSSRWM